MEERRAGHAQLQTDIAVVKEIVERLEHRLFGNGSPGQLKEIDDRFDAVEGRVSTLEIDKWKVVGALGVIATLASVFGPRILNWMGL